jgi:hypothetical protein
MTDGTTGRRSIFASKQIPRSADRVSATSRVEKTFPEEPPSEAKIPAALARRIRNIKVAVKNARLATLSWIPT